MTATVEICVVAGPLAGQTFRFDGHDILLFGRAGDCQARLPDHDKTVSRHHFILEVAPPAARLRDLGSLNGTALNGVSVTTTVDVRNGDEIRAGDTTLRVSIRASHDETRVAEGNASGEIDHPAYEFIRKLGQGGMGAVHLVRRRADGRLLARKIMLAEGRVDDRACRFFEREISVTSALRHPNIVEFIEFGSTGSVFWFLMEVCEGGSLEDLVERRGRALSLSEAAPIMMDALEGLAFAHASDIIHRDIKPGNILLTASENGSAKIADMGLAKNFKEAGLSGMTVTGRDARGTLRFMPREQLINFKYVHPATDVWSAAATFYYILTGEVPRRESAGASPVSVVINEPAVPIRERRSDLPIGFASVIDRALASGIGDRHPTARAFKEALQSVL